jgi:hypothetical protein
VAERLDFSEDESRLNRHLIAYCTEVLAVAVHPDREPQQYAELQFL